MILDLRSNEGQMSTDSSEKLINEKDSSKSDLKKISIKAERKKLKLVEK